MYTTLRDLHSDPNGYGFIIISQFQALSWLTCYGQAFACFELSGPMSPAASVSVAIVEWRLQRAFAAEATGLYV
jgi:hypothetical protein